MTASVRDALEEMGRLVRRGEFAAAADVGNSAATPLGLGKEALKFGEEIASGATSTVHRGTAEGRPAALKRLRISSRDDLERFRKEVAFLAELAHPRIVGILGARALPPDYVVALALHDGTLADALHRRGWRPSPLETVRIARQVAEAVAHCHEHGVVHRDIKPGNVLLSASRGDAVLADFGLAERVEDLDSERPTSETLRGAGHPTGGFLRRRMVGTLEYMAPELLLHGIHSPASDVYAFAVMANEVLTGVLPFSDCTKDNPECHTVLEMGYGRQELAAAVAAEGLRPIVPRWAPQAFAALLERCWHGEPGKRPPMRDVVQQLVELEATVLGSTTETLPVEESRCSSLTEGPLPLDTGSSPWDTEGRVDASGAMAGSPERASPDMRGVDATPLTSAPAWLCASRADGASTSLMAGSFETIGPREAMEDRCIVERALWGCEGSLLVGVFDGHRGHEAAEYARGHFLRHLGACAGASGAAEALREAFLATDLGLRAELDRAWVDRVARMGPSAAWPRQHPGAAAAVALVVGGEDLWVANAGDCRAVLCRGGCAEALTRDHTAADPAERARVASVGGTLRSLHDGWRVGTATLQVTRSLGDFDAKAEGVTAEPEVRHVRLTQEDEFLILASDGVWDTVPNDDAVGLVKDTVKDPAMCGKRIATEALTRGSRDNITVVVVFFKAVQTLEKIYDGRTGEKNRVQATAYGTRATYVVADEARDTY